MMLRGTGTPVVEWRNPVSISCEINVLIAITSRRGDAGGRVAKPGLHFVRDQRLDRDNLAALGLGRNVEECARHQMISSRQAPRVMTTSIVSDQNEPSLSSAIATIFCVSTRRMRVATVARPARGPRWMLMTFGCGFFSVKMWIAFT